jgi:hypothetical protein
MITPVPTKNPIRESVHEKRTDRVRISTDGRDHNNTVRRAAGIIQAGEASLFRPEDGHYTLIVRVQMNDWPRIVTAAK